MYKWVIVYLSFSIVFTAGAYGKGEKRAAADFYYSEALARIARGEFNEALKLLDRLLERNSRHGPALLERGRLYLKLGLLEKARQDLYLASFDPEPEIRVSAHIGLGDIYRQLPMRNLQAASEYRLALQADPRNREALYALALTGFALAETQGYRMAGKALAELLCLDPDYRDAYSLWRGKIRDQSEKELRDVDACLEEMISHKQGKSHLWLDIATSFLVPGVYRLLVELRDNATGDRTQGSLEFEIASPRK